ncbi:hypothetical protein C8J57DRAFT_1528520 [Mycena rebaudengoi]|nr:hypothetical protein C8J57DRAFT_1528520 [Mycena rebaudengoi]
MSSVPIFYPRPILRPLFLYPLSLLPFAIPAISELAPTNPLRLHSSLPPIFLPIARPSISLFLRSSSSADAITVHKSRGLTRSSRRCRYSPLARWTSGASAAHAPFPVGADTGHLIHPASLALARRPSQPLWGIDSSLSYFIFHPSAIVRLSPVGDAPAQTVLYTDACFSFPRLFFRSFVRSFVRSFYSSFVPFFRAPTSRDPIFLFSRTSPAVLLVSIGNPALSVLFVVFAVLRGGCMGGMMRRIRGQLPPFAFFVRGSLIFQACAREGDVRGQRDIVVFVRPFPWRFSPSRVRARLAGRYKVLTQALRSPGTLIISPYQPPIMFIAIFKINVTLEKKTTFRGHPSRDDLSYSTGSGHI